MKQFRNIIAARLFVFLCGISFLNVSFVIAEFNALGHKDSRIIQNILNGGMMEEEKETEKSETDSQSEIFLSIHNIQKDQWMIDITGKLIFEQHKNFAIRPGHYEKFCPPPESLS